MTSYENKTSKHSKMERVLLKRKALTHLVPLFAGQQKQREINNKILSIKLLYLTLREYTYGVLGCFFCFVFQIKHLSHKYYVLETS